MFWERGREREEMKADDLLIAMLTKMTSSARWQVELCCAMISVHTIRVTSVRVFVDLSLLIRYLVFKLGGNHDLIHMMVETDLGRRCNNTKKEVHRRRSRSYGPSVTCS